jgi:hypothetical protein
VRADDRVFRRDDFLHVDLHHLHGVADPDGLARRAQRLDGGRRRRRSGLRFTYIQLVCSKYDEATAAHT